MLLLCGNITYAQFTKANLVASGLTCSMCNLATQKQLQSLNFIDSIVPDLELNAFHIYFNQKHEIDFSLIKQKVEDAGFFVAELKVIYKKDSTIHYRKPFLVSGNSLLHTDKFDELKEIQEFKFIDEGFVTAKENKKYRKTRNEMQLSNNENDTTFILNHKIYYVLAQ